MAWHPWTPATGEIRLFEEGNLALLAGGLELQGDGTYRKSLAYSWVDETSFGVYFPEESDRGAWEVSAFRITFSVHAERLGYPTQTAYDPTKNGIIIVSSMDHLPYAFTLAQVEYPQANDVVRTIIVDFAVNKGASIYGVMVGCRFLRNIHQGPGSYMTFISLEADAPFPFPKRPVTAFWTNFVRTYEDLPVESE